MSLYKDLMETQQQNSYSNEIVNAYKSTNNPQQLLFALMQKNPSIKQILNMANQSGMSYKDLFYAVAKQKGIDPNQIINMLR